MTRDATNVPQKKAFGGTIPVSPVLPRPSASRLSRNPYADFALGRPPRNEKSGDLKIYFDKCVQERKNRSQVPVRSFGCGSLVSPQSAAEGIQGGEIVPRFGFEFASGQNRGTGIVADVISLAVGRMSKAFFFMCREHYCGSGEDEITAPPIRGRRHATCLLCSDRPTTASGWPASPRLRPL